MDTQTTGQKQGKRLDCGVLKEAIETCPDDLMKGMLYAGGRYCALGWLYHVAGWHYDEVKGENYFVGAPTDRAFFPEPVPEEDDFWKQRRLRNIVWEMVDANDSAVLLKTRKNNAILYYKKLAKEIGCTEFESE